MPYARYALSDDEDDLGPPGAVKAETPAPQQRRSLTDDVKEENEALEREPEILQLSHAWANERGAPEVLQWRGDVVEAVMDQIRQQQAILESLASDASTSDEEHFRLNLVQLDVDRAKWLLRSYVRARIDKVRARGIL